MNDNVYRSMNSIFITLIPKEDRSKRSLDYCPISLLTNIYKITTNVLSIRLSEFLDDAISLNQSVFMGGR